MKRHVTLAFQEQHFAEVVALLSTKLGLNILVDDQPLDRKMSLTFDGTVQEILNKVGDTFDYSWRQKPGGIVVMYKRFQDVAEHPQYNLPELKRMTRSMVNVLKAFPVDPDSDFTPRLNAFFALLTPDQVATLRKGTTLYGSDLNAQQADALQGVILQNMIGEQRKTWPPLATQIDWLDHSFLQIIEWPTYYLKAMGRPVEADVRPRHLQMIFDVKPDPGAALSIVLTEEGLRLLPLAIGNEKP